MLGQETQAAEAPFADLQLVRGFQFSDLKPVQLKIRENVPDQLPDLGFVGIECLLELTIVPEDLAI